VPRSWPGYVAPLAAAVTTLFLVLIQGLLVGESAATPETVSPALALAGLLGLAATFVVPVLWGWAILAGRPLWLALALAPAWLAVSLVIAPGPVVWPMAAFVAAGLAVGLVLVYRLRLDAALAVVSLVLAPYYVWSVLAVPPGEQFSQLTEQYIEARREMLAGTADPRQIELTLAAEREQYEQLAETARKIFPAVMGSGIAGMAGILLALVWLTARALGLGTGLSPWPPFGRWRFPFYLVWSLVAGLGLVITRMPLPETVGINIVVIAVSLLGIQGAAVQWEMTGRTMNIWLRTAYLLVAGFIFLPLVLLGLADQWLDFRKLEASSGDDPPAEDNGTGDDAPVEEADDIGSGDD